MLLLLFWLFYDPTRDFTVYTPGMDKLSGNVTAVSTENVNIGEHFLKSKDLASTLTGTWSAFRGNNHDNILKTNSPINENWKAKDPKIVWKIETGEGHASPAVYKGLVYFIDYDEKEKADVLKCVSLEKAKKSGKDGIKSTLNGITECHEPFRL